MKVKFCLAILCLLFMVSVVSATCNVMPCINSTVCPGASSRLHLGNASIDYTVIQVGSNATRVQFKDLSGGNEKYVRWDFGDGQHLESYNVTYEIRNPIHVFPKFGHYISCLTNSYTTKKGNLLWVHKDIVVKKNK